jgi:hypothetical protein
MQLLAHPSIDPSITASSMATTAGRSGRAGEEEKKRRRRRRKELILNLHA